MLRNYMSCFIGLLLAFNGESRSCNLEGMSYSCNGISQIKDFPPSLPYRVQKVSLTGTHALMGSFPNGLFQHISWMNVSELCLLEFTSINAVDKSFLDGLKYLRYLSISICLNLNFIDPEVFHSTPDLEALYLDYDKNLKLSVVENALMEKANNLKYLSLRYLQMGTNEASFLGDVFFNTLKGKELVYLYISYANIAGLSFNASIYGSALYYLRYLNVSHSKMPCTGIADKTTIGDSVPNLQVLDISGCESLITYFLPNKLIPFYCANPPDLKYYFTADLVLSDEPNQLNLEIQVSKCDCKRLEVWDLSSNNIIHFNTTKTESNCFPGLMKIDLSKNGMRYISPSCLSSIPSLKIIDLSENQLHQMQDMEDFSNLLTGNPQLEVLFLQKNHLTSIPTNFLCNNAKLLLLDLRENELTEFSIDFSHILNLKYINLGKNQFGGLPSKTYQTLEVLYAHQAKDKESNISYLNEGLLLKSLERSNIAEKYRYSNNPCANSSPVDNLTIIQQYIKIDLSDNHIECKCENVDFLKWAVTTKIVLANGNTLTCTYGHTNYLLNNELIQKVESDCQLSGTIIKAIAASVSVIITLSIAGLLVRRIRRKRQEKKDIENLKHEIGKCHRDFNYIAFVPFCSHDNDFVETIVLHALRTNIRRKLKINEDVLCTGNDNFRPGMLVIDEIHRCMNESLVVAPIITPAFIQSEWSQTECAVAIQKHKKVLILMEEGTVTSQAERAVQELIKHYTRATWSNKEGQFAIRPSWDVICDRIVALAAETLRNKKQIRGRGVEDLIPLCEENPL